VAVPIAIAVVEQNNCFLIGKRPPGVVLAGYWEFPGGKILDGEEPSACAARECREETGVDVEVGELLCEC
jgi:8-oxo-dGTP diphosphatase